ncbi:MAG: hypothetical protein U0P81_09780 [Holophagaceae bacterium]
MALPLDLEAFVARAYAPDDQAWALGALASATAAGGPATDQMLRCAAMAGRGTRQGLREMLDLLTVDWREVLVAGEYAPTAGGLRRVRDLSGPIPPDSP